MGGKLRNADKIILDLCGGTGAWSDPYAAAGYDRRVITLPEYDIRTYQPPTRVWGILAAPPCNCFSRVGARWWLEMDADGRTAEAIEIFRRCLELCQIAFEWWALENPLGRHHVLMPEIPRPSWQFQPYFYGDPYVKQTYIWGTAAMPWPTNIVQPEATKRAPSGHTQGHIAYLPSSSSKRAITPAGFARAFYETNK